MKKMFQGAIEGYLDCGLKCSYIDETTGARCFNTKDGHAKGHQAEDGSLLEAGDYEGGAFDSANFQDLMTKHITEFLQKLKQAEDDQKLVTARQVHRINIRQSSSLASSTLLKVSGSRTCFGCLFEAPEYRLPCDHFICEHCLRIFDQSTEENSYPSLVIHRDCFLCGDKNPAHWPFELRMRPPLGGLRVLSLDGGGVRGIIELVILKRLLSIIGLSMRTCNYFDLIVGTSAGK